MVADLRANLCKSCYNDYCKLHRKRINTVIGRIFEGHKRNAEKQNIPISYNLEDFMRWVGNQDRFFQLFRLWEESKYNKDLKPCVIRKSPVCYDFSNLLVVSYKQSREYKVLKSGRRIQQLDHDLNLVAVYPSIREAARQANVTRPAIKEALKMPHRKSDGYYWRYA